MSTVSPQSSTQSHKDTAGQPPLMQSRQLDPNEMTWQEVRDFGVEPAPADQDEVDDGVAAG